MSHILNFFGGPGIGKSTAAAELFVAIKKLGIPTELVPEYAKWATYEKRIGALEQDYIFSKQLHNQNIFSRDVEVAVTDSPLLLTLAYCTFDQQPSYASYVWETFNLFNNVNILLVRNEQLAYQQYGRNQTLDEAVLIDIQIKEILKTNNVPFIEFRVGFDTIHSLIPTVKSVLVEK
jgi:adenylate kinase family enzyme